MTSRKIALRENIATLSTLLNCFYYFMYRTKSGPHMLTYFKSTKPILSRQTWKIQKCIFQVWWGILLVVNFFCLLKKQLLLQSRKRRGEEERRKQEKRGKERKGGGWLCSGLQPFEPGLNLVKSRPEPSLNQVWTWFKPILNVVETKFEPAFNKV